jgi:hypothetical protein
MHLVDDEQPHLRSFLPVQFARRQSHCTGEPRADVAAQRRAESRCRCGSGEPSPGADVAAVSSHAGTASDRTIEVRATSELFRVITSHFSGVVTMT